MKSAGCRDEGVQLSCLRLVHALLRQLKTDDIVALLPTLATFVDSRSVACRAAMYDVVMWLYDNYNTGSVKLSHYCVVFSTVCSIQSSGSRWQRR